LFVRHALLHALLRLAAEQVVHCVEVIADRARMRHGIDEREVVGDLGQLRVHLIEEHARHPGGDGFVRSAIVRRCAGFHIPGVDVTRPATEQDKDAGLVRGDGCAEASTLSLPITTPGMRRLSTPKPLAIRACRRFNWNSFIHATAPMSRVPPIQILADSPRRRMRSLLGVDPGGRGPKPAAGAPAIPPRPLEAAERPQPAQPATTGCSSRLCLAAWPGPVHAWQLEARAWTREDPTLAQLAGGRLNLAAPLGLRLAATSAWAQLVPAAGDLLAGTPFATWLSAPIWRRKLVASDLGTLGSQLGRGPSIGENRKRASTAVGRPDGDLRVLRCFHSRNQELP
jgi:hypothetical protein